jgi:hypothetical protein
VRQGQGQGQEEEVLSSQRLSIHSCPNVFRRIPSNDLALSLSFSIPSSRAIPFPLSPLSVALTVVLC